MASVRKWHVELSFKLLDDAALQTLIAAIDQTSAKSAIRKKPSVAASLAALVAKSSKFVADGRTVGALVKQLQAAIVELQGSRSVCELELTVLKRLVENYARSAADVTGMGFSLLTVARASKTVPDAPESVLITTGRAHGKATATVAGEGWLGTFAAQATFDPLGPTSVWFSLPGSGKQRKLAYPTGTKVWVQFAQVRYGLQSPWSTPVMVTMP